MAARDILMSAAGAAGNAFADDVFSTYLYTGNGSTQTINNGIDLLGKGGLVWVKQRSFNGTDHLLRDTAANLALSSNLTNAGVNPAFGGSITSVTSSGFGVDGATTVNGSGSNYVSWTFRKAPKFFDVVTYTGNGAANRQISHSLGVQAGFVMTKSTSTTGDWNCYHRSATGDMALNTTAAQTGSRTIVTAADASTFTVNGVANTNGVSYVAYVFAHDTDTVDGIIQCGSFTTDSSGNATVNLGWEPQYLMVKSSSWTDNGARGSWQVMDTMRGLSVRGSHDTVLFPNTSYTEAQWHQIDVNSTGFNTTNEGYLQGSTAFIYLTIRRPNKPPTTGTQVFSPNTLNTTNPTTITTGFTPDLVISKDGRASTSNNFMHDRLRGADASTMQNVLLTSATSAEVASSGRADLTTVSGGYRYQSNVTNLIGWAFCRAKGFFDIVCDTGTGAAHAIPHGLGTIPNLSIRKSRSGATQWEVFCTELAANEKLVFNSTAAKATDTAAWNSTTPSATTFTVGTGANVNTNAATYVTYLFATLAGISKVGSYTGNGTSLTVNCGFAAGARFVLIKRTDSSGDWYVWDSARGIVAGNDPHLSLNAASAEVTTDDSIDPDTSGFIVNQLAATNINVNAANYIFLAIA